MNHESVLDPAPILQTAFGFWGSKVLLTAVEFGVVTTLSGKSLTGPELGAAAGIHPRGISDFFDALVSMKFLERDGDGPGSRYSNTAEGELFLVRSSPRYIGGILEMLNARLFKWHAGARRPLLIRTASDPWQILVAEVMSQQTGIERVGRMWRRFVDRWPSPGDTLPVTVDARKPERLKVEWDEVESARDRAWERAEQLAASEAGGGVDPDDERAAAAAGVDLGALR